LEKGCLLATITKEPELQKFHVCVDVIGSYSYITAVRLKVEQNQLVGVSL
jgi:hypothetical protein